MTRTRITPEQAGKMLGIPTNAVRALVFNERLPIGYSIPTKSDGEPKRKRTFYIFEEEVKKYIRERSCDETAE